MPECQIRFCISNVFCLLAISNNVWLQILAQIKRTLVLAHDIFNGRIWMTENRWKRFFFALCFIFQSVFTGFSYRLIAHSFENSPTITRTWIGRTKNTHHFDESIYVFLFDIEICIQWIGNSALANHQFWIVHLLLYITLYEWRSKFNWIINFDVKDFLGTHCVNAYWPKIQQNERVNARARKRGDMEST